MEPADRHPTYRARDLLRVPCLLSLARVPLAGVFPLVVADPRWAFGVLALSGISDVLDGWWARRFHQTSDLGAALDGITDKVFVLAVAVTLLVTARLTPVEVVLLGARDIGEIVLLLALMLRRDARARHEQPRADVFGKATTLLQFVAVSLALVGHPSRAWAAWGAGLLGAATAVHYARRMR
jgi:cardiolipin synthase